MKAIRHGSRYQRTIRQSVEVRGVGFLTGADVAVRFQPAPVNTGVVFTRSDLRPTIHIPARVEQVTGTARRTTLGRAPHQVSLVEHVLAALAGLRIDNCHVELNAPEPPGMDGSARDFVEALLSADIELQGARRAIWTVDEAFALECKGATLTFHPTEDEELRITYMLDYGHGSPIDRQTHTAAIDPERFRAQIAPCRTFVLESEIAELRGQGLGSRTTTADLLVFGPRGPIDNALRFADEPARHKILDLVGDLSLFGHDLRGHLVAYRSGHPLNVEMARTLSRCKQECCSPLPVQRRAA